MPIYCIDDGGDGSQNNATQSASTLDWSKADASVADLIAYDAAAFTTSGNIIFFGDDTADPNKAANWTLTGPSSGLPVILISADRTQATPTYKKGTGNQLSSLGGGYTLTLDGSFQLEGIRVASGDNLLVMPDENETVAFNNVTLASAANKYVALGAAGSVNQSRIVVSDLAIDLTADGTTARSVYVLYPYMSAIEISGLAFTNAGYRTGTVLNHGTSTQGYAISGADFSGFVNGTACEIVNAAGSMLVTITNCLTAATWTPFTGTPGSSGRVVITNTGPADAPTYLAIRDYLGDLLSSASIYRTGGAAVEGAATAWLITTTAACSEGSPFYTPWIYFKVASAATKTVDIYCTNDTGDLTNAEAWIEVEAMATENVPTYTLTTDQRATITTTAAAQTDDTTSSWSGTGPSFTYKQELSASVVVGEEGLCRARVAIGKASIAGSAYMYVDPQVFVDGVAAGTGQYLIPGVGVVDYPGGRFVGDRTGGLR